MSGSRHAALLVVLTVAACSATVPRPSATSPSPREPDAARSTSAPASASPRGTPTPRATAAPTPAASPIDLDIGQIDAAVAGPILEAVSDGSAIWYSAAGPRDTETTPDLYRYVLADEASELVWRNPDRARSLVKIGGHHGTIAFADLDVTPGVRAWSFWLIPELGFAPFVLDQHPGDADVPGFVPSFHVDNRRVAWTSFDRGPSGPVSELWLVEAPTWEPRLLASVDARERELWFPSLFENRLAYVEVVYGAERRSDQRHVMLLDLADPGRAPRRLDTTGLATMPLLHHDGVIWKENDVGFSMFTWGRLVSYSFATAETTPLSMHPQEFVNYPSRGYRFVAAWGSNASALYVHDLERGASRMVERYADRADEAVDRPSLVDGLLVWLHFRIDDTGQHPGKDVRWAFLPVPGSDLRCGGDRCP